jgi:hypothetical protein
MNTSNAPIKSMMALSARQLEDTAHFRLRPS